MASRNGLAEASLDELGPLIEALGEELGFTAKGSEHWAEYVREATRAIQRHRWATETQAQDRA